MAGIPQVKLEHLVNGSWLDVTSRLLWSESGASLQIQRGVADDGAAMVGTASFTLDNSDGALTPRRPGSPHYPYLIRFRPVRFTAFIGGSWRARHYGFLDSEVLTFGNETATDCRVTWSTIDHFGMAGLKALRSIAVEATAALGPLAYWPLTDPESAAASDQSSYSRPGLAVQQWKTGGEMAWGAGTVFPTDSNGGMTFTPASDSGLYLQSDGTVDLPTSWSLSVFIYPGAKDGYVCQVGTDSYSIGIWYDTSTKKLSAIETKLDTSGDPIDYVLSTTSATWAGGMEQLTVTPTTVKLDSDTGSAGSRHSTVRMLSSLVSVGGAFAVESGRARMFSGEVKHLAIWSGTTPAGVFTNIATGPAVMFTMSTAIQRLMAWAGLTVTVGTQGTDPAVVLVKTDGSTPLDIISSYARGSLARIFCLGDGTIRQSGYDYTPATVTADAGVIGLGVEWSANPAGDPTDAVMTWPDGSTYTATETAPEYRSAIDLPGVLTNAAGRSVADWLVVGPTGEPSFPVALFDLLTIPASDSLALLESGSILSIPGLPSQLPASTQQGVVQSVTETLGASEWSLGVSTDSDARDRIMLAGDATRGVVGAGWLAGPGGGLAGPWRAGEEVTAANLNSRQYPGGFAQCGAVTMTPTAGVDSSQSVTFPIAFATTPEVVLTAVTSMPFAELKGVSVASLTSTGFVLWMYRTTAIATTVYWSAVD